MHHEELINTNRQAYQNKIYSQTDCPTNQRIIVPVEWGSACFHPEEPVPDRLPSPPHLEFLMHRNIRHSLYKYMNNNHYNYKCELIWYMRDCIQKVFTFTL